MKMDEGTGGNQYPWDRLVNEGCADFRHFLSDIFNGLVGEGGEERRMENQRILILSTGF